MNLSGNPVDYLVVFLGGVFLSFTPCVYPLIPISASFIGARSSGSRLKGFVLSLFYVIGVAVSYALLGLVASLTGKIFGSVSSHPLSSILVGGIVIFFGLSMLDIFTFSLPILKLARLPQTQDKNYLSSFILGLSSGFIVSPCITPVLGSILLYLTTKKNIWYGTTLLFVFALGMGILLIVIGTFSGIVANLPKSGKWMVYFKKICALVLIGLGIYLVTQGIRRI